MPAKQWDTNIFVHSINNFHASSDIRDGESTVDSSRRLVEVVLSTLEAKLRPVENADRAIQRMMRRMAALSRRVDDGGRELADLARRAEERHAEVSAKLDHLTRKFDSVCEEDVQELEDIIALPSVR